jgi:hypothetical protein
VRVDVGDLIGTDARALERSTHHAERAIAVLGRCRDVIRVRRHAVAHQLGVDPRAAAPSHLVFLENQHAGTLADNKSVAIVVERPAARCGSSLRGQRASPRTRRFPIGVIAAPEPPAIMMSATSRRMISKASPIACAEAEQAVQVAELGPGRRSGSTPARRRD